MLLDRWLHPRPFTPRGRLGVGVSLSAVAHAGCLVLLVLVVTHGRSLVDGDGEEGDRVDVTTVGEPGPPGDSERESGQAARPTPERPRRVAAAPARPRAVTGAVVRPASGGAARPARALATSTPGSTGSERALVPARAGPAGPSPLVAFRAELKQKMRQAWRAREIYERIDPQGRLQGSLLITKLNVRLRSNGTVEKAVLHDSSGIPALDSEASAAIGRMKPLSPLPVELVDAQGGFLVRCAFHLDLGLFRFANQLHRTIAEEWQPGRAFQASGDHERVSVVQLTIDRRGALIQAAIVQSAGIDFLDRNATAWARPGMTLPPPPANFMRGHDRVPVFVAFAHMSGRFVVRDPEEDLETE
jgi:TonB family protein